MLSVIRLSNSRTSIIWGNLGSSSLNKVILSPTKINKVYSGSCSKIDFPFEYQRSYVIEQSRLPGFYKSVHISSV